MPRTSRFKHFIRSAVLLAAAVALACGASAPPPAEQDGTPLPTGVRGPASTSPTLVTATPGRTTNQPVQNPETPELVAQPDTGLTGTAILSRPGDFQNINIEITEISEQVTTEVVAQGLEVPWEVAFTPAGRILITERAGRIRVIADGKLLERPYAVLEQVISTSESGLMGLAVHPQFADNGHLYVCYTYQNNQGQLRNRVARLTDSDGQGTEHQSLVDGIPGARNHDGCRLGFGPDGKLYVTMGDAQNGDNAQDLDSLAGKILRLDDDGTVPDDNPFPGSYVFTYGHRNPQGMDWHPATGDLFITEHGPNKDDEVNILEPGLNYGWPEVTGKGRSDQFVPAILTYTPTIAIAGAAFYDGDKLHPSWQGDLIFAALKDQELHRIGLTPPDFQMVDSDQVLFEDQFGRLRAVAVSPDGYLYFTTSNRDGRGSPKPGDDKLMRLVPVGIGQVTRLNPDRRGDFAVELGPGAYRVVLQAEGHLPQEKMVLIAEGESVDLGQIRLLSDPSNPPPTEVPY